MVLALQNVKKTPPGMQNISSDYILSAHQDVAMNSVKDESV